MRRALIGLAFVPLFASAGQDVSFDFAAVSVGAFAQSTFKGLLHRDFVMAPELQSSDRKISISVSHMDAAKVPEFVEGVLAQQGIGVVERGGVFYLGPSEKVAASQIAFDDGAGATGDAAPGKGGAVLSNPGDGAGVERVPDRRVADLDTVVFSPLNRTADFLAAVVVGAFGHQAAVRSGSAVVLTGTKADIEKMRSLLSAVDLLPKLVDVSASWVEVTSTASSGRGISLVAKVLGERLALQLGSVSSGSAISFGNANFQLVLDALNSDGRFKQVSNSRVVGDEYEKLLLSVGDETPTVASTGKDNSGNAVQNIVYRPSGVIVDVTPKVLGNGKIRLTVDGQISNFKATSTGVTGSPTLIKRQVKTTVTVADGEVLLIGGLNDVQNTDSASRWAFLPDSWSAKSKSSSASDLVLVLSAKVATPN